MPTPEVFVLVAVARYGRSLHMSEVTHDRI